MISSVSLSLSSHGSILHLLRGPSFDFLLFFYVFHFLHWDIRSCTTSSSTFCMQGNSFRSSSLQHLFQLFIIIPLHFPLVSFLPVRIFFLLFVFDLRAIPILLHTLPNCSLYDRLVIYLCPCLLLDIPNTFRTMSILTSLSLHSSSAFSSPLPPSLVLLPGNLPPL